VSLKKQLRTVAAVGALVVPAFASAQMASLKEVVESAVLSNPEIQAKFNDFTSALEGQNVSRGAMLPQVTAQGWTGRQWSGGNSAVSSSNWSRNGYSVELRQLLFDGLSTLNTTRQFGFEKLAGYYDLLATIDSVAADAAVAYIDVIRFREMENLARDNYQMHDGTLRQIRERQESGVGRGVDLEQANGRLALAQTNLMTESNNLNDVLQRFRRVVGSPPAQTLVDPLELGAQLPKAPSDFSSSIRGNPAVLSKQALYQAADYGVDAAKGRHMPTFELRASTGRDTSLPGEQYRNIQNSSVQLMMSYNLYKGGSDQARVRQTKAQSYAARDVRDYTCRNLQQDLSVAWNRVVLLRQQLPFLQEHELATSKVRQAYQQQFQIGQRSLLDLLDTENELFDARRALANATYDLKIAEYRWLAMSHKLLPVLGLAQPYDALPDEAKSLDFPEESLKACMTPAPDTRNLEPVKVLYRDGMLPPVVESLGINRSAN